MERVNGEWLQGRCGARQGIFPAAYVRVTVPLPGEPQPQPEPEPEPSGALVLFDFRPQEVADLALTVGGAEWDTTGGVSGGRDGISGLGR